MPPTKEYYIFYCSYGSGYVEEFADKEALKPRLTELLQQSARDSNVTIEAVLYGYWVSYKEVAIVTEIEIED